MYLSSQPSIILTVAMVAWGAEELDQLNHRYYASSFEDLVHLAKFEIELINHLKDYQKDIAYQLKAKRKQCQVTNKFSYQDIVDISRTLPSENDVIGGAIGLVYIQLYYDMQMKDMERVHLATKLKSDKGSEILWRYQSPHNLASEDVAFITKAAQVLGRMDIQIDWLDFALQNFNLGEQDRKRFRKERKHAILESDEILISGGGFTYDSSEKKFMNSKSELIYHNPTKKEKRQMISKKKKHMSAVAAMPHAEDMFHNSAYMNRLLTIRTDLSGELCRGNMSRRLAKFISDSEQTRMKQEAITSGMVTTPYQVGGIQRSFSHKRSSKVAYLADVQSQLSKQISRRIETVTSFNVVNGDKRGKSSENLQVMNYGLGGTIQGHLDTSVTHKDSYGDIRAEEKLILNGGERLATFMMFLSSPGQGGNTIFPQLGISVKPLVGSALMWINIRSNGLFDTRVFHMGCPVLQGNKWIANKWVLWNDQMLRYLCKKDRTSHYSLNERIT